MWQVGPVQPALARFVKSCLAHFSASALPVLFTIELIVDDQARHITIVHAHIKGQNKSHH